METRGFGVASAPLMCGYTDIHKELEDELTSFHGTDATVLYPSGYHANLGFFHACFGSGDLIISDSKNHASIVDGIRLSKAKKSIYKHIDFDHLESILQDAQGSYGYICVVTEGVYSMDADIIDLKRVVELCNEYNAILYLDDCHGSGVIGKTGRGTPEYCGVDINEIPVYTSTIGKGISGSGGGYTTGRADMINWLKHRSRTFIYSNSLAAPNVAVAVKAIKILKESPEIFETLVNHAHRFRKGMKKNGFEIYGDDDCAICPIKIHDSKWAKDFETILGKRGIYVIAVGWPAGNIGEARIRIILSYLHSNEQIDRLIKEFKEVADEMNFFEKYANYTKPLLPTAELNLSFF